MGTNSSTAGPNYNSSNTNPLAFPLFKTNDVVVAWHGDTALVAHLIAGVDWDKIKSPLSVTFLFHNFFEPYFEALKKFDLLTPNSKSNLLFDYSTNVFFMAKDQCFCFDNTGLYEVEEVEVIGTDGQLAYDSYKVTSKKHLDGQSICRIAVEAVIKNTTDTVYPILLLKPEDDDLTMIEENGTITKVKIPTIQDLREEGK